MRPYRPTDKIILNRDGTIAWIEPQPPCPHCEYVMIQKDGQLTGPLILKSACSFHSGQRMKCPYRSIGYRINCEWYENNDECPECIWMGDEYECYCLKAQRRSHDSPN